MTIKVTTELTCNNCGKKESYIGRITDGMFRKGLPKHWLKIESNLHSVWFTSDFSISGDFCSPECIISYVQKKIQERDNPVVPKFYAIEIDTKRVYDD